MIAYYEENRYYRENFGRDHYEDNQGRRQLTALGREHLVNSEQQRRNP
jgi:hypothetical protein